MRIWDIQPKQLCQKHLIAEHRELHGLWNILTIHGGKGGYSNHPETKRWVGKLKNLYHRHDILVEEMAKRGYKHFSPLDKFFAKGKSRQDVFINTIAEQKKILKEKNCECLKNH